MKITDDELAQRIQKGDSKSFEELVRRYAALIYGFAFKVTASQAVAEEVAQETWIRALKNIEQYRGENKLRSWLLTICRNLAISELRKKSPNLEVEYADEIEVVDERALQLEELLQTEENFLKLKNAMMQLPERQRVVLSLFMTEEQTLKEIAEEMRLKENAVKALLFRAKESLKKILVQERMSL